MQRFNQLFYVHFMFEPILFYQWSVMYIVGVTYVL